jgi:5-methylcytosine-specific restriction endonuclease McrA
MATRPRSSVAQGYDAVYKRLRPLVLARDRVCTICRKARATEVDHIVELAEGGRNEPTNLRGVCKSCNVSKARAREQRLGYPNRPHLWQLARVSRAGRRVWSGAIDLERDAI